jgi:hypothetical protein
MKKFQAAQGDVLIESLTLKPDLPMKPMLRDEHGRLVLALGETSGHVHAVFDPRVVAWMLDNGNAVLEVQDASEESPVRIKTVTGVDTPYENHTDCIITEPGFYGTSRQQEYDPWGGWRQAAD